MKINSKDLEYEKIQSAQDTHEIMRKIFFERHDKVDFLKEHFWTFALNRANKILSIELVSMGSDVQTIVAPPEVFRIPLYKGASHLILVNNQPSGVLKPNEKELDKTNKLIQSALLMDIEVVDHVIVTAKSYYSFFEQGLIEKLRWNNKYALTFVREKQIKKEISKNIKKVALGLLQKGIDRKTIEEVTGLTPQQIGKLARGGA